MNASTDDHDTSTLYDLTWGLYCEVRNEIVESIKLNHQITALKATFVSGSLTIVLANLKQDFPFWIICLPIMSIVFFDYLMDVRRYVIFRNAYYIRETLEPILKKTARWPEDKKLFEEFLYSNEYRAKSLPLGGWIMNLAFCVISLAILYAYEDGFPAVVSSVVIALSFLVSLYIIDPGGTRRHR